MTVGVHCRRELEREIAIMQPKIDKLDEGLKEKVCRWGGGEREVSHVYAVQPPSG
jgi:hypothetical protein